MDHRRNPRHLWRLPLTERNKEIISTKQIQITERKNNTPDSHEYDHHQSIRFLMQTEFRAIVQSEYGAPEKVLRIAKRQLESEELGAGDALVKIIARPIHHGDIQILSALPQGRPVELAWNLSKNHPTLFGVAHEY